MPSGASGAALLATQCARFSVGGLEGRKLEDVQVGLAKVFRLFIHGQYGRRSNNCAENGTPGHPRIRLLLLKDADADPN